MKAMVLHKARAADERPLAEGDLPIPAPGPGQIRVRVGACAVCHTDLHIVEGELALPRSPIVPGHQIVGVVDEVGPGVSRFRPGDRVGLAWVFETCGSCEYCRAGRENLCDSARFRGLHVDGGYAEYALANAAWAWPVPAGFSDAETAPLLCAGVIGYRALRLSGVRPGGRLGMWGFGASAHVTIQVARHWGCEVFVVTRSPEHQAHARALGAAWAGGPGERPPRALDGGINFTPAGPTVAEGLRALRKGATLALAGIHMSPLPPMEYSLIYGERALRSVANATRRAAEELLALAAAIPIHTDFEAFPLSQANEALSRMKHSRIKGAAVLSIGT
ncbi:MAG: zinc-dependent alcohol dehydrogenase family protein [Candidatus Sumerlaeota bacterium]|nr:zinc-dependent alcohol dehydrogenase family protein [Candidatus Sumerlaeota bacterium]